MIRIDMEYMESIRSVGIDWSTSPDTLDDEGGQLTEAVRRASHSWFC
jgi:hypothetical protein